MFDDALSFSRKASSGLGIVLGCLMLDVIDLPRGIAPAGVPHETITRLGLIVGIGVPLLYVIPINLITQFFSAQDHPRGPRRYPLHTRSAPRVDGAGDATEEGKSPTRALKERMPQDL